MSYFHISQRNKNIGKKTGKSTLRIIFENLGKILYKSQQRN